MITKLGMVSFIIVEFIYVIYQQISITVQYKINLKCIFKDILNPTLSSVQNHTLDGRIMYLTGTLVINVLEQRHRIVDLLDYLIQGWQQHCY